MANFVDNNSSPTPPKAISLDYEPPKTIKPTPKPIAKAVNIHEIPIKE